MFSKGFVPHEIIVYEESYKPTSWDIVQYPLSSPHCPALMIPRRLHPIIASHVTRSWWKELKRQRLPNKFLIKKNKSTRRNVQLRSTSKCSVKSEFALEVYSHYSTWKRNFSNIRSNASHKKICQSITLDESPWRHKWLLCSQRNPSLD